MVIVRNKASIFWCSLVMSACGRRLVRLNQLAATSGSRLALWLERVYSLGFSSSPEVARPRRIAKISTVVGVWCET